MFIDGLEYALIPNQELFSNLKKSELEFVISNTEAFSLAKKESLFSAGEKASRFYILADGEIRVFKKNENGNEEEMAHFRPGDTIGDFDFARGAVYDAYAEAAKDSNLIAFPGNGLTMDSLAQKNPDVTCSIMLNAIIMMTARIKEANQLVLDNLSWAQDLHRRAYEDTGTGLWKQTLIADEIKGKLNDPAALIMLKPDHFKTLVDSRGHAVGDEAMVKIALILKNATSDTEQAWPMRFKSNETGLILNNCGAAEAQEIAETLAKKIAAMEPVPASGEGDEKIEEFYFSATISWCIWPLDDPTWNLLFHGNYAHLLEVWKTGGNTVVHYKKPE